MNSDKREREESSGSQGTCLSVFCGYLGSVMGKLAIIVTHSLLWEQNGTEGTVSTHTSSQCVADDPLCWTTICENYIRFFRYQKPWNTGADLEFLILLLLFSS